MPDNKRSTISITIEIEEVRAAWLAVWTADTGRYTGRTDLTLEKMAGSLVHNAILDFQRDRFPDSHPDETPGEYEASKRGRNAGDDG